MSKKDEALKLARHVMHNQGDIGVDEWIATEKAIDEALAEQHEMTNIERHERNVQKFLAEQPAQQQEPEYAWPTVADYERDVGFQTNEAFRIAWNMARTTNRMLGHASSQPARQQEPVAFEEWLAKQHGDPEEIGFLQALRIAYNAGQDSITKGNT